MDWGNEQQIEISVGAYESETGICRHVNFCWSKVHAINPMLHDNDLVQWMLLSFSLRGLLCQSKIYRYVFYLVFSNIIKWE